VKNMASETAAAGILDRPTQGLPITLEAYL
jgi:hypothetical protein